MRIGVISEGHADRAVIQNIIIGVTGLDTSDFIALRPAYKLDETDKANNPNTFGSYSLIKKECEDRELIDQFLQIEGQDFIVLHIDTAEADNYGITRPDKKSSSYSADLRSKVIEQINNWLKIDLSSNLLYAIAIEEIDAWLLTIYENKISTSSAKPKEKLQNILGKKKVDSTSNYENYFILSKKFSKTKEIKKLLGYNQSLQDFYSEVEIKIKPKLNL